MRYTQGGTSLVEVRQSVDGGHFARVAPKQQKLANKRRQRRTDSNTVGYKARKHLRTANDKIIAQNSLQVPQRPPFQDAERSPAQGPAAPPPSASRILELK